MGAHCSAEATLIGHKFNTAEKPWVTCGDRGRALYKQEKRAYPASNWLYCGRHLGADLVSSPDSGTYNSLLYFPPNHEAQAMHVYGRLSPGGVVAKLPKEEVFPCFLPEGVCSHEVRTNNFSEVLNITLLPVRREVCLYKALMLYESIEFGRTEKLRERVLKQKTGVVNGFPEGASVPSVLTSVVSLLSRGGQLAEPERTTAADGSITWRVASETGGTLHTANGGVQAAPGATLFLWDVKLAAVEGGLWHAMCGCGMPAVDKVGCKHFQRTLGVASRNWRGFLKPWLTPEAWEAQVGRLWTRISAQEVMEATETLRNTNQLVALVQPRITGRPCGKPRLQVAQETDARLRSFIEDLEKGAKSLDAAALAQVGGAKPHNPGGTGVRKHCSLCKAADMEGVGHTKRTCPNFTDGGEWKPGRRDVFASAAAEKAKDKVANAAVDTLAAESKAADEARAAEEKAKADEAKATKAQAKRDAKAAKDAADAATKAKDPDAPLSDAEKVKLANQCKSLAQGPLADLNRREAAEKAAQKVVDAQRKAEAEVEDRARQAAAEVEVSVKVENLTVKQEPCNLCTDVGLDGLGHAGNPCPFVEPPPGASKKPVTIDVSGDAEGDVSSCFVAKGSSSVRKPEPCADLKPGTGEPEETTKLWSEFFRLAGDRYSVRGNGSCWLYALLGALGELGHGSRCPLGGDDRELLPTTRDGVRIAALLRMGQREAQAKFQGYLRLHDQNLHKLCEKFLLKETWPGGKRSTTHGAELGTPENMGDYGGNSVELASFASLLECNILVANKGRLVQGTS